MFRVLGLMFAAQGWGLRDRIQAVLIEHERVLLRSRLS